GDPRRPPPPRAESPEPPPRRRGCAPPSGLRLEMPGHGGLVGFGADLKAGDEEGQPLPFPLLGKGTEEDQPLQRATRLQGDAAVEEDVPDPAERIRVLALLEEVTVEIGVVQDVVLLLVAEDPDQIAGLKTNQLRRAVLHFEQEYLDRRLRPVGG